MRNLDAESRCGISMRNLDAESRCGISMRNLDAASDTSFQGFQGPPALTTIFAKKSRFGVGPGACACAGARERARTLANACERAEIDCARTRERADARARASFRCIPAHSDAFRRIPAFRCIPAHSGAFRRRARRLRLHIGAELACVCGGRASGPPSLD